MSPIATVVAFLDVLSKISTILIGVTNILLVISFFIYNNNKDNRHKNAERKEKENDRKVQLLKSLVLDHALTSFYSTFDEMSLIAKELKIANIDDKRKSEIDSLFVEKFSVLRQKLFDPLFAIDLELYNNTLKIADTLQAELTDAIFDDRIDLSKTIDFEAFISEKLTDSKTAIIKQLFCYRG